MAKFQKSLNWRISISTEQSIYAYAAESPTLKS
jgi:hypothetical protein